MGMEIMGLGQNGHVLTQAWNNIGQRKLGHSAMWPWEIDRYLILGMV